MNTFMGYRFHWTTGGPVLVERCRGRKLVIHPPPGIFHYDWGIMNLQSVVLSYELIASSFSDPCMAERWDIPLAKRWIASFHFGGFMVTTKQVIQAVRALEQEATSGN